ncbi:MAG: hypothetical protein WDM88_03335 [Galbitalea sp.]
MSVDLDDVQPIVDIAARAGLAALDGAAWLPTDLANEWMLRSNDERWASLAGAWFAGLPGDIHQLLSSRPRANWGARLAEYVRWLYPAGGTWMRDRALAYSREAEVLGITANSSPSSAGSALLTGGEAAAATIVAALFPPEVDRVYVQHDLTIVAPGPLVPPAGCPPPHHGRRREPRHRDHLPRERGHRQPGAHDRGRRRTASANSWPRSRSPASRSRSNTWWPARRRGSDRCGSGRSPSRRRPPTSEAPAAT